MSYTEQKERQNVVKKQYNFGVKDRLNREIGAEIITCETTFVPAPAEATGGYPVEAGTYFTMCVHATRNNQPYGAWQGDQYFKTANERETAIDKYLQGANKRALKREAK